MRRRKTRINANIELRLVPGGGDRVLNFLQTKRPRRAARRRPGSLGASISYRPQRDKP